jgi:hypothetical protein
VHLVNHRLFSVVILGLAVGCAATQMKAQGGHATFNLAFPVHVGNVTLQPGEYRVSVPSASSPIRALYLYGDGKVQAALPSTIGSQAFSDRSYLELINIGGVYFAHKYTSGVTGMEYTFDIPKKFRREIVANARATSVAVSGGAAN